MAAVSELVKKLIESSVVTTFKEQLVKKLVALKNYHYELMKVITDSIFKLLLEGQEELQDLFDMVPMRLYGMPSYLNSTVRVGVTTGRDIGRHIRHFWQNSIQLSSTVDQISDWLSEQSFVTGSNSCGIPQVFDVATRTISNDSELVDKLLKEYMDEFRSSFNYKDMGRALGAITKSSALMTNTSLILDYREHIFQSRCKRKGMTAKLQL